MERPRFFRTLFLISLFLLCIVLLHTWGALRFIERPLTNILHSGSAELYSMSVWNEGEYRAQSFSREELQKAFVELQEKYRQSIVDTAELEASREENESLKKQVAFFSEKQWRYETARITGKHIDPFASNLTLYVQNAEGRIVSGVPAITDSGIFVGVVTHVLGDTVTVRLLDDGQTKVGASLLNEGKTIGVVEGGFGKSIRMNFIPQNEDVSAGDIVVSSGLSDQIPYGLPIGTIEAVEKEPYQPFQSAVISPLTQHNTLQVLSLITEIPQDS